MERLAENRCREGQHFESLSHAERDAAENASCQLVSDSRWLADTAVTLLIASSFEPIGYREFESFASAKTLSADTLSAGRSMR